MPRHGLTFAVSLMPIAFAAAAIGCNGGGGDGAATPGVSPEVTMNVATPTLARATLTPAPDIRLQDLTEQAGLQEFLAVIATPDAGQGETIYADITGDGVEEAVVSVASGGTAGNLAVFVFGYGPGGLSELLREHPPDEALGGHIRARVESGQLILSWPIYGPDDPNCCPSQGFRVRYYLWDGSALALEREEQQER